MESTDKVKYIFGSEDSTDLDIVYVFDKMPSLSECKKFCSADPTENRNIIVIEDGEVVECYKGTVDETNNAILFTYHLHPQQYPLYITHKIRRDPYLKFIRATRIILSHLSRSSYRSDIKSALKSTRFNDKIRELLYVQLDNVDFTSLNKNLSQFDIKKVIAFQIGQSLALAENIELYSKKEIGAKYPMLYDYLYRIDSHENASCNGLQQALDELLLIMSRNVEHIDSYYDVIKEKLL